MSDQKPNAILTDGDGQRKKWQARCTLCKFESEFYPSLYEADAERHRHYIAEHVQPTHVRIVEATS